MKKYILDALKENSSLLIQNQLTYTKGVIKAVNILTKAAKKKIIFFGLEMVEVRLIANIWLQSWLEDLKKKDHR